MKKFLLLLLLLLPLQAAAARLFVRANSDNITATGTTSNYGTANQSYSFWFYPVSSPAESTEWILFLDWLETGKISVDLSYEWNGSAYLLRIASSSAPATYQFRYFYATGAAGVSAIPAGVWYHMAVTIEPSLGSATDAKWYVDGAVRNRQSDSGGSWSPGNGFYGSAYLGANNGSSGCDCRIADFAWWQGVLLNTAQITALSRGARPDKVQMNPTRYYPLEGWQSTEPDYGQFHLGSTSITGTSRANGPPVVPR
jgi:hypothetical protein